MAVNKNPLGGTFAINEALSVDRAVQIARDEHHISSTMLDNLEGTVRLKVEAGVLYAVFRDTGWEPGPSAGADEKEITAQAKAAYQKIRDWQSRLTVPIHFMVNCEQDWSDARNFFYAKLVELNASDPNGPVGLVLANYGAGRVQSGQGTDENWWSQPGAVALLTSLSRHKYDRLADGTYANVLGIHNYTGLFPWIGSNGGNYDPNWELAWPSIDWAKAQWHLGREWQGIEKLVDPSIHLEQPWMIVTEGFFDAMTDVIVGYEKRNGKVPLPSEYSSPRGWRSLTEFWRKHFGPTTDVERLLHEFHVWAWREVFAPVGNVLATQVFFYGTTFDHQFRVDNAPKYHELNCLYVPSSVTLPPRVQKPPQGAVAYSRIVDVPKDFVNIRDQPTTNGSAILGQLHDLQIVLVFLDHPHGDWYYVLTDIGEQGWINRQNGAVKFLEPKETEKDMKELLDDVILVLEKHAQRLAVLETESVTKTDMVSYAEDLMNWTYGKFPTKLAIQEAVK